MGTGQPDAGDPGVSSAVEYLRTRRLLAVTDSLLMISHAAEQGRGLRQEDVKAVLEMSGKIDAAGKAVSAGHPTPDEESRFWEALSRISNLVRPANAAAIRERSRFLAVERGGLFAATIGLYKSLVWLVLAATLVMHGYHFTLGAMIAEAKESVQRFDAARTALFTAIASRGQGTAQAEDVIAVNLGAVCESLSAWRLATESIAQATLHPGTAGAIRDRERDSAERALCEGSEGISDLRAVAGNLNRLRVVDQTTQRALRRGVQYRDVVGQFILPLLYGTLGAVASIVRALSTSIREIRYSRAFRFEHGMRIPLGALAGATVGLVAAPETLNTAFGLTMLGLAFGFGYSVDVFFAVLDGLVARLAQRDATCPGESPRPSEGGVGASQPKGGRLPP